MIDIKIEYVSTDQRFTLEVDSFYTIRSIKKKIQTSYGILMSDQVLLFESARLEDDRFIDDFDIQEGSIIYLVTEDLGYDSFRIFITLTRGITPIEIKVQPFYKVQDLKWFLMAKTAIPAGSQRFLYRNQKLEESRTLSSYDIKHNSTIYLLLRLPGS